MILVSQNNLLCQLILVGGCMVFKKINLLLDDRKWLCGKKINWFIIRVQQIVV